MAGSETTHRPGPGAGRHSTALHAAILLGVLGVLLPMLTGTEARAATPEIVLGRKGVGEYQGIRGGNFLAWQQNTTRHPGQYDVFARPFEGGDRFQVNPEGTEGANGDIDEDVLVYQEFQGQDSDLKFFDLVDRVQRPPPSGVNSRQWEYWPSMSGRWLLFGRLLSNGDRRIILFDLTTGDSQTLDRVTRNGAFAAPGQVNGDWAAWYRCSPDGECDVVRYHILDGATDVIPNPGPRQRVPAVTPTGTVYFARSDRGCGNQVKLVRYTSGGQRNVLWRLPDGHDVGSTRVYADDQGDVTFYFDDFTCGRAARSDVWEMVERGSRRLEVEVDGHGTVTSSPAGIACGADCDESYDDGTAVTLRATPDQTSAFTGWQGDCSGTTPTCTVTMDRSRSVTANFGSGPELTVTLDGNGEGTVTGPEINCPGDCSGSYQNGRDVTLTATAGQGSVFDGWGGACGGTASTCELTMSQSRSVTATFRTRPRLTVTIAGNGQGSVTGPGIDCPGDCSEVYDPGTDVTLTESAGQGSSFGGWGGACATAASTCELTMSQSRTVSATFGANPVLTVDLAGTGQGSVAGPGIDCPGDCSQAYAVDTEVTLDAVPEPSSTFEAWSGDCSGQSCTVTMSVSRQVTATFDLLPPNAPAGLVPWFRRW